MSIGNSINSLPLAYAPVNGAGRYVAYALASLTVEATATPLPSFIAGPAALGLTITGGMSSVGLRLAPAAGTLAAVAATSIEAVREYMGTLSAGATAAIAAIPHKIKASGVMSSTISAGIAAVPLRIRQGASDFTSLYTSLGARSSGPALNTFVLNLATLDGRAGQHRRTFEVLFTPIGSVIFSASISLKAEAEQTSIGNVLFGGFSAPAGAAAFSSLPNAIFDPTPSLDVVAGASPSGVALRATGGTFDQTLAAVTALGNFIAGPSKSLSGVSASAFSPSVVFDALSGMDIASALAALAKLLAGGTLSMEGLAATVMLGGKIQDGEVAARIITAMDGIPWVPLSITESTVFADAWDKALGSVVVEDIVCLTTLEAVVYKTELESIVYGEME